jgi:two-component system osmolarity sensor histidine kinase EnvZ
MRGETVADIEEMDNTIGQFLDFARADGGEPMQETDLFMMLSELAALYARRNAHIELDAARLPPLVVRPKALRRAITNLVENALRHGGPEVPVTISLHAVAGEIRIDVADRGPGIPPAEAERLKLPFTRLENARTGAVGAGLGLAIVDRIARSHGGRFDLLPREGGGLVARIAVKIAAT